MTRPDLEDEDSFISSSSMWIRGGATVLGNTRSTKPRLACCLLVGPETKVCTGAAKRPEERLHAGFSHPCVAISHSWKHGKLSHVELEFEFFCLL